MNDTSGAPSGDTKSTRLGSSTVAIGTATMFIAIAAGLSFVADDDGRAAPPAAWTLRGSVTAEPSPPPVPAVKRQQVARSDVD